MNGCSAIHLSIFGMNPVVKHGTSAIRTFARRDGDTYVVRGQKVWTSKAQDCEKVLLLVRTSRREDVASRMDGMTLLLADLQSPQVDIRPIPKAGRNAVASREVRYDDHIVPVAPRVEEEGQGQPL